MPIDAAAAAFTRVYGRSPSGTFAAPGRVNLMGEHTDYNDGFVLPLALAQRVTVAVAPAVDPAGLTTARSRQRPDEAVQFSAATVTPGDVTGWGAYVAGVAWALREAGHPVPDVDLLLSGNVPLGAGLSSSAALECAVAVALAALSGLQSSATDLALVAQRAENGFVGAPTGVMDQMASMHGEVGHVVFLDTRSLAVEAVPFDPAAAGLELLVIDTQAPHELVDGQYAARRDSCRDAAARLEVPALRDIDLIDLPAALARLPEGELRRRTRHVVTENARVLDVVEQLRSAGDLRDIGPALTASHASMRDDFEITVPAVDLAVEAALADGAYGARMTGGGFGGCVIALVERSLAEQVFTAVEEAFARAHFTPPARIPATPSGGAGRV